MSGLTMVTVVGANGFEPSTSWSRTRSQKILSALSGVASGLRAVSFPLSIVRTLSANWVTNGNRPHTYPLSKVNDPQFVLRAVGACDSARMQLPQTLGSARFQHFPPHEPVCLGLVARATIFSTCNDVSIKPHGNGLLIRRQRWPTMPLRICSSAVSGMSVY